MFVYHLHVEGSIPSTFYFWNFHKDGFPVQLFWSNELEHNLIELLNKWFGSRQIHSNNRQKWKPSLEANIDEFQRLSVAEAPIIKTVSVTLKGDLHISGYLLSENKTAQGTPTCLIVEGCD